MKFELLVVTLIGITILYENYIKQKIASIYEYGKIASILCMITYILYLYMYKPTEYYNVLTLAKEYMLNSTVNTPMQNIIPNLNKKEIRNVTGLMKKKVAANQKWQCGHCRTILDASYEVDHIIALYKGGTNEEANLVALCRNCHGNKTVKERLI
jgi:hypothetical protein